MSALSSVSKNKIVKTLLEENTLVQGMDKVLKKLSQDHDIIIISETYSEKIEIILKKNNLLDLVDQIFAKPSTITDDGKLLIHSIPRSGSCASVLEAKVNLKHKSIGNRAYDWLT